MHRLESLCLTDFNGYSNPLSKLNLNSVILLCSCPLSRVKSENLIGFFYVTRRNLQIIELIIDKSTKKYLTLCMRRELLHFPNFPELDNIEFG